MPGALIHLETFGCQMNELDSELVAGRLRALGYAFTRDAGTADIVLYNTCSVRDRAEQKVWSRLGELKKVKANRPELVVGVLGCMAERDGAAMIERMPVVDILCGPGELDKLPALIDNAVRTRRSMLAGSETNRDREEVVLEPRTKKRPLPHGRGSLRSANEIALQGNASRRSSTLAAAGDTLEMLDLSRSISPVDVGSKRSAYVRITRGCNKFCTYCVVPRTRGAEVHRPPAHIVDECKKLADAGIIEVTLLGQTVNHYRFEHGSAVSVGGITQPQKGRTYKGAHNRDALGGSDTTTFAALLALIHEQVPAIERLRFVTCYPRDFGDDVLEVIRDCPRICRYLHVPAQSGSDRLLAMMNRGYTVGDYYDFLDRARAHLHQPEIGRPLMISGDIIVGFPTETEADFEATKEMVRRSRAKNQFIFKYSPRPGTVAWDKIADDVPESDKRRRNNELLALQSTVSGEIGREQVGRTFPVFVEGLSRAERKRRGIDAKPGKGMVEITMGGSGLGGSALRANSSSVSNEQQDAGSENRPTQPTQLTARTDGDLIVHFEVDGPNPADYFGRMVDVRITEADGLALQGELLG